MWGQMSLVAMEPELAREISVTEGLVVPLGDGLVGSSPRQDRDREEDWTLLVSVCPTEADRHTRI